MKLIYNKNIIQYKIFLIKSILVSVKTKTPSKNIGLFLVSGTFGGDYTMPDNYKIYIL